MSSIFVGTYQVSGGVGGRAPQNKTLFWGRQSPPPRLVPKNTFTDAFENTCDMSDFRAHIFCPQTTQELPIKEAP